jgi:hypothetical protein
MSYQKLPLIAANPSATPPVVGKPARISFYFPVDKVFDDASMRSMYQARNMKDQTGATMVDDFAITEDERNIYMSLLEDAVFDVFLNFLKYTKGIDGALQHNADYVLPAVGEADPVTVKASFVQIVDNANYNENYLQAIDMNMIKTIRFYTLRDWFESQGKSDEAAKFNNLYILALRNVKNYAFQLKKAAL